MGKVDWAKNKTSFAEVKRFQVKCWKNDKQDKAKSILSEENRKESDSKKAACDTCTTFNKNYFKMNLTTDNLIFMVVKKYEETQLLCGGWAY